MAPRRMPDVKLNFFQSAADSQGRRRQGRRQAGVPAPGEEGGGGARARPRLWPGGPFVRGPGTGPTLPVPVAPGAGLAAPGAQGTFSKCPGSTRSPRSFGRGAPLNLAPAGGCLRVGRRGRPVRLVPPRRVFFLSARVAPGARRLVWTTRSPRSFGRGRPLNLMPAGGVLKVGSTGPPGGPGPWRWAPPEVSPVPGSRGPSAG